MQRSRGTGPFRDHQRGAGARTPAGVAEFGITALAQWMWKNGYARDELDFYDMDMLLPTDDEIDPISSSVGPTSSDLARLPRALTGGSRNTHASSGACARTR